MTRHRRRKRWPISPAKVELMVTIAIWANRLVRLILALINSDCG